MIDFSALKMLIGPRFKRLKTERGDREKLARSHMRRAKGAKNHSTNKERSYLARLKNAERQKKIEARLKAAADYKDQVIAYWRGERETHP